MSLFTWWKAVPCRRIPLTSMLYFAIQPALWRGFVVLFIETPFFDLHHCYRILTVSLFQFTSYLQDLDSLPFSVYMLFTGSWKSPFFNLHVIYRILTVSLFQFLCYLQDLDSLPFSIYMLLTVSLLLFTCYLQNLDSLHFSIYMLFTGSWQSPFSIYMLFTGSWQSPFFNLHVVYRILTVSPFWFTCYLQHLDSPPFSIYMLFRECWQSPFFNLHVIYRILTVSLFIFSENNFECSFCY